MSKRRDAKRHRIFLSAICALLLVACGDDGTRGELDAKRIYGDLSGLYYGAMCEAGSVEVSELRSRALRVTVNGGKCAVLYLDGVDPKGGLLIYPGGDGVLLDCHRLAENLTRYRALQRVVDRVQKICIS